MSKDGFILRGALAPPNWTDIRIFDDQTQSGIHLVAPSDGSSWGILIIFCGSLSYGGCFQNLYRVDTPPNYRFLMNTNEWSEWKAFSYNCRHSPTLPLLKFSILEYCFPE